MGFPAIRNWNRRLHITQPFLLLRDLPIQVLKIDRSFVAAITHDAGDLAIVDTIIGLAHAVGAEAVAEGIEDEETFHLLAVHGCDLGQGYHIGRPVDAGRITEMAAPRVSGAQRHVGAVVAKNP